MIRKLLVPVLAMAGLTLAACETRDSSVADTVVIVPDPAPVPVQSAPIGTSTVVTDTMRPGTAPRSP